MSYMATKHIDMELEKYIHAEIIPQYVNYDKGHNINHIKDVMKNSLEIAQDYDVNINMVFTIAAYHDLGIRFGRQDHNVTSSTLVKKDLQLQKWFSNYQIEIIAEAVEDHRASNDYEPRSIYGKIISEADRNIDPYDIIYRTMEYGKSHFPDFSYEKQLERTYSHIIEKYSENGYVKLWLNTKRNTEGLKVLRELVRDKESFYQLCKEISIQTIIESK